MQWACVRPEKSPRRGNPIRRGMRIVCMSQTKENISVINRLVETLKDGQEGFRQASEAVQDSQLKSLFSEYSLQRSKFAGELQDYAIKDLGESDPENTSSTAGALHRAWINIKSAVSSRDDHAILAECERGEDSAVAEYKRAMEANLPSPLADIVSRQYTDIKAAHDHVRSLRDPSKNPS